MQNALQDELATLLEMQAAGDVEANGMDLVIDVDGHYEHHAIFPNEADEDDAEVEAEEGITRVADEILAAMKVEVSNWSSAKDAHHEISAAQKMCLDVVCVRFNPGQRTSRKDEC